MAKRILVCVSIVAALIAIIFSLSYVGAQGFDWFAGLKMSNELYKDSIGLATFSVVFVGIALSVSGTALQALTKNKLASSYSLGTITGASLAMVVVRFIIVPSNPYISALLILLITMSFSFIIVLLSNSKANKARVIVIGLIISVFFSALNYMLRFLLKLDSEMIGFLSIENISVSWASFQICAPLIVVGVSGLLIISKTLWIYEAYEDKAKTIGINIPLLKWLVAIFAMINTAAAVLLIGPISFVGIVIPHITNMMFRTTSLTFRMLMNIPISIVVLCVTLILYRAFFYQGVSINVIISIMAFPIVLYHVLRRSSD